MAAAVGDARTAGRRPGQLRLGRRRSARGHALHRGAHDPSRRRAHGRHGQGHGRFRPELRRDAASSRPCFPRRSPICSSTAAPASPSAWRRTCRRTIWSKSSTASARRSTIPDITLEELMKHREGPGFPDRLRDLRRRRRQAISRDRPRQHESARQSRRRRAQGRQEQIVITEIPYNVNRADAGRAHRRAGEREGARPTSARSATNPTKTRAWSSN